MGRTLELSKKWASVLVGQQETGMGYQIATLILSDGRQVSNVTIAGGIITEVPGYQDIPFLEEEIVDIRVTRGK